MPQKNNRVSPALKQRVQQSQAAFERNDYAECERLCRSILEQQPDHYDARRVLGMSAVKTRQLPLALDMLTKAAAANRRDATVHTHLSAALLLLNRSQDALRSTARALKLAPDDTLTLNIRACALGNLNRHQASLAACDRALAIKPDYVEVMVNRGNALVQLNRPHEALASFEQARQLKPDFVHAINNCANVLKQLQRYDEALARYQDALRLHPNYAEAAYNCGVTLSELGRPHEARDWYLRALEIQPDYLDARYNLAHCRLQLGDFKRGWIDYEAQWQKSMQAGGYREFTQPLWLGAQPLNGKTVLLHAEAGLGDTIQFCRYAAQVKARGARVLLQVQRPLLGLLANQSGADKVIATGARLPKFDYHCPLMSLPGAFNTTLKTMPRDVPYIAGDSRRAVIWKKRLGKTSKTSAPRIGLAWSGNPAHSNDSNRSLALADVLPLLQHTADWLSLQKELRANDAVTLAQTPTLRHFGAQLKDFADTAALIENMDLVIAVDTSIAHLAGAMGKPLWLLLPFNPDWRWLLKRRDSPWYPSARLFRQPAIGDWASVIKAVRRALSR